MTSLHARSRRVFDQVVNCRGVNGTNAEYVTRLADFVRRHIPHDDDHELFLLDAKVRRLLADVNDGCDHVTHATVPPSDVAAHCELREISGGYRLNRTSVSVRAG